MSYQFGWTRERCAGTRCCWPCGHVCWFSLEKKAELSDRFLRVLMTAALLIGQDGDRRSGFLSRPARFPYRTVSDEDPYIPFNSLKRIATDSTEKTQRFREAKQSDQEVSFSFASSRSVRLSDSFASDQFDFLKKNTELMRGRTCVVDGGRASSSVGRNGTVLWR